MYRRRDQLQEEPKLTEYKLTSTDYATSKADLRRLITPAGLAWLRASTSQLKTVVSSLISILDTPTCAGKS